MYLSFGVKFLDSHQRYICLLEWWLMFHFAEHYGKNIEKVEGGELIA